NKAHSLNPWMIQKGIDGLFVSVNDVENSVGQPCLAQHLGQLNTQARILLAWLQNERVATSNRDREHPHRNHGRKIERRDSRDNPKRLAERETVNVGAD